MNCNELQTILLETPNPESEEARAHLASCLDCRRFAEFQSRLATDTPAIPSANLDRAVLGAAEFRLAKYRRNRFRRRLLAIAAAVAVLFGWLAIMQRPDSGTDTPVIAQNPDQAESIWADGTLEEALRGIEEQATLLSTPLGNESSGEEELPSLNELDDELLELELDLYFERATLGEA